MAGRIERPGPAYGSPKGVSGVTNPQNEPNSPIWVQIQLPKYCELSEAIQHESLLFDVLGGGKSRIVIIKLDFVKSSIFDELSVFRKFQVVCGGFRIVLGSPGILAYLDDVFWCKDLLKTFKTTLQIGIRRPQRPAGLDLVFPSIIPSDPC